MSMLSRGNQLVDFKHFENVKSLFENVSLYIGLIAYTAAGAKVRSSRLQGVNSIDIFGPQNWPENWPDICLS